ncbi:MAG: Rnf-Nqr domain containing protein [Steroidobacteraceae bacterium]|jgi:electron transport complex protein RnfE|nr:Rnf-Nqr domain containing protein [Steroidobacteraceae bacterium]
MSEFPLRSDALLLLAMCPALAVSDTVVNAVGLGLTALVCGPLTAVTFGALRSRLTPQTSIAGLLLLSSGAVASVELLMRAYSPILYTNIWPFVALFSVNFALLDALMAERSTAKSTRAVLRLCAILALALLLLGIARELVGRGSILHGAGATFGDWAQALETKVFAVDMGFLLGMLPPGAFIALALLIAALNWLKRAHSAST